MDAEGEAARFSFERSAWAATAGTTPLSPPVEPDADCDVIVIGGGISGAVATATLAEGGARVVLVEAGRLGSGATGRSGGFVVPAFPVLSPRTVLQKAGSHAERLVAAVARSADLVFDLVRRHGIDCDAGQNGWFQPTLSASKLDDLAADAAVWARFGTRPSILDAKETEQRTGVAGYLGSCHMANGGTIHPVKFVQDLVRAAIGHGARCHERTPARAIRRNGSRWQVDTPRGTLSADTVLICTNGQSPALTPALHRALIPATICQSASVPIPAADRAHLFGQGTCLSDTRVNLFTYRFDADWRLISGSLPLLPVVSGSQLGTRIARRLRDTLRIEHGVQQEFVWFGRCSVTEDFLPRAMEVAPGAYAFSACNGRGLALSAVFAHEFGRAILAGSHDGLPVPLASPQPFRRRTLTRIGARLYPLYGAVADWRGASRSASGGSST